MFLKTINLIKSLLAIKNLHNKCVDPEKPAGSRVLLTQHPRPSRFSGHDSR